MWTNLVVILLVITSVLLLLSRDWRWTIAALAFQYFGVFLLVTTQWPLGMALIKLVVGWMAGAALGVTRIGQSSTQDSGNSWISSRTFQLITASLVLFSVFSISDKVNQWLPGVSSQHIMGGLVLITIGLLHLGMTAQPFQVVVGLLTILSGFEVIYAAVEISVLVAGLLAGVNLGLAMVGIYLIMTPVMEERT